MECDLGDIKISYRMEGTGRPFLMLHGSVGDHDPWTHVFEPVWAQRQGWKRIYPDLPGHGGTPAPDWLRSNDQVLDILLRFIDAIAPGERLVVGGFSLGGYFAQGLVCRRFSQMDGLLLLASSMHRQTEKVPKRTILLEDNTVYSEIEDPLRMIGQGVVVVQDRNTTERLKTTFQGFVRASALDDPGLGDRIEGHFSFEPDKFPQPFDKPTLLILALSAKLHLAQLPWASRRKV